MCGSRRFLTDDFELKNATTAVTDPTYHGSEDYEIDEILADADDYVVIANPLTGRGSSSGAPVDLRWASVFNSRRAAVEAVGLA